MTRDSSGQQRHNFLVLFLATLVAMFLSVSLILLTGGFFFYVLAVLIGMLMLGLVHYIVWGANLEIQVAGEREEELLRQRAEELSRELEEHYRDDRETYRGR